MAFSLPGRELVKLREVLAFSLFPFFHLRAVQGFVTITKKVGLPLGGPANPLIHGCLRSGGQSPPPVFDFEIVEKNGAGCKLVLPGRGRE
jgi:hypothetical protein